MTPCRCTSSHTCLNCSMESARIARLKAKDAEEAIAIGEARYERNSKSVRGWR